MARHLYQFRDLRNGTIFLCGGIPYVKYSTYGLNDDDPNVSTCVNMHGQHVVMHDSTEVYIVGHLEDYYEQQASNPTKAPLPF